MRYYLAMVLAAVCVHGFAADQMDDHGHHHQGQGHHHHHHCSKLNLEEGQKTELKAAFKQLKADLAPVHGDLTTAAKAYKAILSDPKSDITAAEAASTTLTAAKTKQHAVKTAFLHNVIYKILKPEQREAGVACFAHKHHHGKHHKHHGQGHHHHGHGGGSDDSDTSSDVDLE